MDKRVLTTVVVCMAIILGYHFLFGPKPQHDAAATPTATAPAPATPTAAVTAPTGVTTPTTAPAPTTAPTPVHAPTPAEKTATVKHDTKDAKKDATAKDATGSAAAAAPPKPAREPVADTVEETGRYRARFTSSGAAPSEWTLLDPQYQETRARDERKDLRPINLVRTHPPVLPFEVSFPASDFNLAEDAVWERTDELSYAYDDEKVHIQKRYQRRLGTYEFDLTLTVENKTDKPLNAFLQLSMYGWQDPAVKPGGMFSQRSIQTGGLCHVNGKMRASDYPSLLTKPHDEVGQVRWIGYDEKYFLAAAALKLTGEERRCAMSSTSDGTVTVRLVTGGRQVPAKGALTYEMAGFLGPKLLNQLDVVKVGATDAKLGDAVNYGWTEAIARPMLAVLRAVHFVVPNWGLAIIVLTMLIKALTWWPTSKSMKSMKAMAKLKPEMDKLKVKYGSDKTRLNTEVMQLYKQHGVNPLGGCLPILIQMPMYIALYSMLGNSVELYRSGFVGYIRDLTAPDPYYVLPLLTGVLMFLQQRFSPQSADPQQKAMMYTMPLMFTAFSIFLPAGLTIYILTNTLLSMGQQWWLNRQPQKT